MFTIRLEPSQQTFLAGPECALFVSAQAAGIELPHGCLGGNCGSCLATLRTGEVCYPQAGIPAATSADELAAGQILTCQARPRSDLVLAIDSLTKDGQQILTLPCRVKQIDSTGDTLRLTLKLPGRQKLARTQETQTWQLIAAPGRHYSVERLVDKQEFIIEIHSDNNDDYLTYLREELKPGDLVRLRGPV